MVTTVEPQEQQISVLETELEEIIDEYYRLKDSGHTENHPKVQYAANQFQRKLRIYEQANNAA